MPVSVRFALSPRIVTYELSVIERNLKKLGSSELCLEHKKERKLYGMVLKWKNRLPFLPVTSIVNHDSLDAFLGSDRASCCRELGIHTVVDLCRYSTEFVLDEWSPCDVSSEHQFELTSMVVLNLVAEFLCQYFFYDLTIDSEQHQLFFNIFTISQNIVGIHFSQS